MVAWLCGSITLLSLRKAEEADFVDANENAPTSFLIGAFGYLVAGAGFEPTTFGL